MEFDKLRLLTAPVSASGTVENSYIDVTVRDGVFPSGAFSLALPKDWRIDRDQPDAVPDADDPIVPLARFSPGTENALGAADKIEIVIWAVALPREIHGADWLHTWTVSQGFTTIDARELTTKFGIMGDALAYRTQGGRTMLHRLYVIKDGDLIFLLDGRVEAKPTLDEPAFQEIILLAMMRFRLLAASGQVYAEPFARVTLSGESTDISLMTPQSWDMSEGADAPVGGATKTFTNTLKGTAVGTLVVTLGGPSDTIDDIEETILSKLQNQGNQIEEPGAVILERSSDDDVRQVLRYDGDEIAVLSAKIVNGGVPISIVLLTPSDITSFEAWAINRRAFDIALNTLKRL